MPASKKTTSPPRKNDKSPVAKIRDRNSSTQKLLLAARGVFSEVGYDAATTKAISQRAGLNESLIQRYFKGKAGLLAAVIHQYADSHIDATYPKGKDFEEEVFNYLKSRYEHIAKNADFVRIAFHRVLADPTTMKSLENQYRHPEVLITRLKSLQSSGMIHPGVDLRMLGKMIAEQPFLTGIMGYAILEEKDHQTNLKNFKFFSHVLAQGVARAKP